MKKHYHHLWSCDPDTTPDVWTSAEAETKQNRKDKF